MADVGRPRKYNTAEELEKRIQEYIQECRINEKPLTVTGLANACEVDRQTLLNYSNQDEFFGTIKKYKEIVLQELEEKLVSGKCNPAGIIFNLKNNYGWEDKKVIESNNTNTTLSIEDVEAKQQALYEELKKKFTIEAPSK